MLVVLQAISHGAHAQRIQLRAHQAVRIGRSEWADVSFGDDSSMSDIHFELRASADSCTVRSLHHDSPTFVNGQEIESSAVRDGDQIVAGQTKFRVRIEGEKQSRQTAAPMETQAEPTALAAAAGPAAAQMSLVATCAYLEFADDVTALATKTTSADDLVIQLAKEEKFLDALRLRAHLLPKRKAVWWGCLCVRDDLDEPLPARQWAAVTAAAKWVGEPDEDHRRLAEEKAAAAKYSGVGATLALSAFWSDGSIAPTGNPDVVPDERLTSQGVAAALVSAAYHGDATKANDRFHTFLAKGKQIADDEVQLPEGDDGW